MKALFFKLFGATKKTSRPAPAVLEATLCESSSPHHFSFFWFGTQLLPRNPFDLQVAGITSQTSRPQTARR